MSAVGAGSESEVICGLEDRPGFFEATLAAFQHVLAVFVGIITPPLIIKTPSPLRRSAIP